MVTLLVTPAHREGISYYAGCEYAAVERLNKDAVLPLLRALVRTPFFRCASEPLNVLRGLLPALLAWLLPLSHLLMSSCILQLDHSGDMKASKACHIPEHSCRESGPPPFGFHHRLMADAIIRCILYCRPFKVTLYCNCLMGSP